MPFEIVWSDSAARQLRKIDRQVARRIYDRVGELAHAPFRNVRRLAGEPYYRLRVGDYRVIVSVREAELRVLVLKIGKRDSIYG